MSRWRPSPGEERWLAVAGLLRGAVPAGHLADRAGGWRNVRILARLALFVLGGLAAVLGLVISGFDDEASLIAGLVAVGTAEWIKQAKRLQGAGIEEGAWTVGLVMVGIWMGGEVTPGAGYEESVWWFVLATTTAVAAWRLLNPLLAASAAIAAVEWCHEILGPLQIASAERWPWIMPVVSGFGVAMACAAVALAASRRHFQRPWHDHALAWVMVVLPAYAYLRFFNFFQPPGIASLSLRATTIALLLALAAPSLLIGLQSRRRAPLYAFVVCLACLAVEFARWFGGPAEAWLIAYGLAALAIAAMLERWLRGSRRGFTSVRTQAREDLLEQLQSFGTAALAGRVHAETSLPETSDAGEPARGGRFGGGGASGNF